MQPLRQTAADRGDDLSRCQRRIYGWHQGTFGSYNLGIGDRETGVYKRERKAELILELAGMAGRFSHGQCAALLEALRLPGGDDELLRLLTLFYALEEPRRRALLDRLAGETPLSVRADGYSV